jgi:hypothetical protein
MIDNLDFSKVLNSHIKPIEFETIISAVSGNTKSIKKVIEHYNPYLRELATKTLYDEYGNQYRFMDETLRCQLENKLIKSVLEFKIQL